MQAKPDEQKETTLTVLSSTRLLGHLPISRHKCRHEHTRTHVNVSRHHISLLVKIKCKLSSRLQSATHP